MKIPKKLKEKIRQLKKENSALAKNNRFTLNLKAINKMEDWLNKTKDSKLLLKPENLSTYLGVQEFYARSKKAVLNRQKILNGVSVRPPKALPPLDNEDLCFPN